MKRKKGSSTKSTISKQEFQKNLTALRKIGALSNRIDIRKQKITRYMLRKISLFGDVLEGRADIIKLPKKDRNEYKTKIASREIGSFLIIPRESKNQSTDTIKFGDKNFVRIRTPLGDGEISQIILPYNAKDLIELANAIQNDQELPEELPFADNYAFALYGHTHKLGFESKQSLVNHILVNYKHLFDPKNSKSSVKHFVLVNYGARKSPFVEIPENIAGEKNYSAPGKGKRPNATGRDGWYEKRVNENKNKKRREKRAKMKPQEREIYLAKMRERVYKKRADKKGNKNGDII